MLARITIARAVPTDSRGERKVPQRLSTTPPFDGPSVHAGIPFGRDGGDGCRLDRRMGTLPLGPDPLE